MTRVPLFLAPLLLLVLGGYGLPANSPDDTPDMDANGKGKGHGMKGGGHGKSEATSTDEASPSTTASEPSPASVAVSAPPAFTSEPIKDHSAACPKIERAPGGCEARPMFLVGKPEHWADKTPAAHLKRICKDGKPAYLVGSGETRDATQAHVPVPHLARQGSVTFPEWAAGAALDAFVQACMQHNDNGIEVKYHTSHGKNHLRYCDVQMVYLTMKSCKDAALQPKLCYGNLENMWVETQMPNNAQGGAGSLQRVEIGRLTDTASNPFGLGYSIFTQAGAAAHALCRALSWLEMAQINNPSAVTIDDAKTIEKASKAKEVVTAHVVSSYVGR